METNNYENFSYNPLFVLEDVVEKYCKDYDKKILIALRDLAIKEEKFDLIVGCKNEEIKSDNQNLIYEIPFFQSIDTKEALISIINDFIFNSTRHRFLVRESDKSSPSLYEFNKEKKIVTSEYFTADLGKLKKELSDKDFERIHLYLVSTLL